MADEGVSYFPLYCTLDEKFELIEAEFGLKGFAIVVKLFQRIYKEHGYYCEWNKDISLIFAKQCGFSNIGEAEILGCVGKSAQSGSSKNLIDLVVAASVRRGIFDERLFIEESILTSRGIQKNFLNIVRNRKKVEIKKEYLLLSDVKIKGNVVIIGKSNVRNSESDVRFKQRKVEESKVKESKGNSVDAISPSFNAEQAWIDTFSLYPKKSAAVMAKQVWMDKLVDVIESNQKDVAQLIYLATKMYLDDYDEKNPDDTAHRYIPKYSDWLVNDCDYWISEVEKMQRGDGG